MANQAIKLPRGSVKMAKAPALKMAPPKAGKPIPVPPPPPDQGFGTALSLEIAKQSAARKKAPASRADTDAARKAGYKK